MLQVILLVNFSSQILMKPTYILSMGKIQLLIKLNMILCHVTNTYLKKKKM